ncbi:hypothetical protein FBQ97_00100 [Acidobacteria bacterium ACD]|nr:MAG: hypothetical protein EDX89_05560 [Acidobacteriota bacterium]MCE7956363.1 hypothetical protein [Acidobacteria bacterium ACB2]MDL1948206.1 hypothetical protein [Acidobacteria bacterium ACD]
MLQHTAAVLPFPGHGVPPPAPRRRHSSSAARHQPTSRLDLRSFVRLLRAEGLSARLPSLRHQVEELAERHHAVFGFGFDPDEIRIPARDLPGMLLGLREGILTRPVVVDSPHILDAIRLGLDFASSMLRYRIERLAASGIRFRFPELGWALWSDLRWPRHGSLAERIRRIVGMPSASHGDLVTVYERLPRPPTIGERLGTAPRLLFVGESREPWRTKLLGSDSSGELVVKALQSFRSAAVALEEGCRFLSPEAALLLLASPETRQGNPGPFGWEGPVWLSGVDQFGRVAMMEADSDAVTLSCRQPRRFEMFDRLPASSE